MTISETYSDKCALEECQDCLPNLLERQYEDKQFKTLKLKIEANPEKKKAYEAQLKLGKRYKQLKVWH